MSTAYRRNWTLGIFSAEQTKYTKKASSSILLTTGATERNKSKNIYDIAGNLWEWTTEANEGDYRAIRGGNFGEFGSIGPAAYRGACIPSCYANDNLGFRATLYIK